ncbi:ERF family protein, partial [Salmonella enterica subsp. enterica]|nr:ERF family protein [Salmonella enterica subsp. enterica]
MSKEFYARLAEIQEHLNAPKNQYNSFGKYKYRSCEDILEGVKPLLKGLFLSISDEIVLIGDRYYVKATATITDGENSHSASAIAREEENKKGMDAAQVTGATSSYARKYCLNGLFGIDDSKDADTDEHKQQQNAAPAKQTKSSPSSHAPEQVLKAFTEAAMQKNTVEELKQAFAKAWKMLEGTEEQAKAKDIYNI